MTSENNADKNVDEAMPNPDFPPHSGHIGSEADHDNVSAMLEELEDHPQAFASVRDAMRLDMTDAEFLDHTKRIFGAPTVSGGVDESWDDFKGDFDNGG